MLRVAKLTDYGIVLMTYLARHPAQPSFNAQDLATQTGLPLPTVGKLLKLLGKAGLLQSQRGVKGGYSLARQPELISVAEVIQALEGPFALTECSDHAAGGAALCAYEWACPTRSHWLIINQAIHDALSPVTLTEMSRLRPRPAPTDSNPAPAASR